MNLHQLNAFKAVVDFGSFTNAAAKLHVAQSAVSYHIKLLEEEVNDVLFLRVNTQVYLTEAGQLLYQYVEKVFDVLEEAQQAFLERNQGLSGELRFGLGASNLITQLPEFFTEIRNCCPGVCLQVTVGNPAEILDLIKKKEIDVGIVSLPVDRPEITTTTIFYEEEEMFVIMKGGGPLKNLKEIEPAALVTIPLILYTRKTTTRSRLDEFFKEMKLTPNVFVEVDREDTILSLVRGGLGATVLPRCVLPLEDKNWSEGLDLVPLSNAYLRREVGIATLNSTVRPQLIDLTIDLAKKYFHPRICVNE